MSKRGGKYRILYVTPFAELGGAEVILLNIVRFHNRSRFEPVVCFLRSGPLVEQVRQMGVNALVVPTGRIRDISKTLQTIVSLRDLIRRESIDLVHSSMAWAHTFGGAAAMLAGVPAVWYQHARAKRSSPLDWLSGVVPARSVYVNSRSTGQSQHSVYTAGSVRLIYCGLDLKLWSFDKEASLILRREFNIPESSPLVVMPGRLQRWKGQHIFIEAASRVLQRRSDAFFLVVGDTLFSIEPEYKEELHAQVANLGLGSRVLFTGMREDMVAIYSAADVVVHASLDPEPFGLTIAEAMAMRRPVVASDSGGPREIVLTGETGYLVPVDNPDILAARIVEILSDPELRVRLGAAGYERVLSNFSVERMISELEADYDRILS
jgi:glycosyltransferase involved in cell wall biosynthesis